MADTVSIEETSTRSPRRKINGFQVFTYTFLTVMAVIYVAPFIWMLMRSVMNSFEANSTAFLPSKILLDNYTTALVDIRFGKYFMNTVAQAAIGITGQTIIALL